VRLRIGIAIAAALLSPAQTSRPQFEVASIKRNSTCGDERGGGPPPSPGRVNALCTTVQNFIHAAYITFADGVGLNPATLDISGPGWTQSETYDVVATAEGNAPLAQMAGPMMQALLEDRFKLKIHRETKEGAVFFLTVAKGGVKLEPTKEGSCDAIDWNHLPSPAPGKPLPTFCGNQYMSSKGSTVTMTAHGITMGLLAAGSLARIVGRPIVDKTGLSGAYDIKMEFTPGNSASDESAAPSIFTALQQLGLKLEPGKGPVESLVIDHVERPSEN
jgi:uncharacterized protein (TIGR03435 family)